MKDLLLAVAAEFASRNLELAREIAARLATMANQSARMRAGAWSHLTHLKSALAESGTHPLTAELSPLADDLD
jgi:hypothetical protein